MTCDGFDHVGFAREIAASTRQYVDKRDADLERQVRALRDRVSELEAAKPERRP